MKEIKITSISPKMCECGRLYCDRRNSEGKMMCSVCYENCSVEELKMLWSTPENNLKLKE
jgi:hypothetical protein